jgi:drug/metabolite transporter (DMT)-like permease
MNMFVIFQFIYNILAKAMLTDAVTALDICLIERAVTLTLVACFILPVSRGGFNLADFKVPHELRHYLLTRSVIGVVGGISYMLAIKNLPVGISMILFYTGPFWATIMSYFYLGELIAPREIICIIVAFTGVVVISTAKPSENVEGNQVLGIILAMLSSLCFASQTVICRKL